MSKYQFGSIVNRDFRNTLQRLADDATAQGKAIQGLVAEGQLTPDQHAELLTVLNNLISRGTVSINDLSEEVLQKMNGSDTTFNILSIPRNNSVTPRKTNFFILSTNLVDESKMQFGYSLDGNGLPVPFNDFAITDFIPINSETFTANGTQYKYYDISKNIVGQNSSTDVPYTFSPPENAAFLRVAFLRNRAFQINEGANFLGYQKYFKPRLNPNIVEGSLESYSTEQNESWVI